MNKLLQDSEDKLLCPEPVQSLNIGLITDGDELFSVLCSAPRYAMSRLNYYFEKKEEYFGLTTS